MKKHVALLFLIVFLFSRNIVSVSASEPDSAFLFSYSSLKNDGHNGLHFAWSIDQVNWHSIGPEHRFLFSDYGRWGAEKRLVTPFLFQDNKQIWHCLWSLNEYDGTFAHSSSTDLIYWLPQTYPNVIKDNNCLQPEVSFDKASGLYTITWISNLHKDSLVYAATTRDFKEYSATIPLNKDIRLNKRQHVTIAGNTQTGTVHKVSWNVINNLIKAWQLSEYNNNFSNESFKDDSARFASMKPVQLTINANVNQRKKISDMMIGVFFEDINYAADGGLYAELIQNRDFEYSLSDKSGRDKSWTSTKAWNVIGNGVALTIDTVSPIHPNNPHYATLNVSQTGSALINEGFNGIAITKGEKYNFSVFVRKPDNKTGYISIRLTGKNGEICGETRIKATAGKWQKVKAVITANKTVADASLAIIPETTGKVSLDMISLFPQKTFKGRTNGLRTDLAEAIAGLHPRFVRFPGGCVAHGDGIGNIYRWKNTIGPLEARKPQRNLWNYHQSAGLGYFEYLQFCEDIGAKPVPVIAAGVPCQNSSCGGAGQQGGIPMCEMDAYIQDILDLIEYCNGDVKSVWGKKRAQAGHPAPFNLEYIGIGNEDLITDIFEERFTKIYNAVKEKHPEITIIGTVGPASEGTDYVEGWKIADKLNIPIVDEHYYQNPGWFINNQYFYDKYDRSKSKVYLGEYASRGNALYNALSEAIYLTALERNADVVTMASYAPLLAKEGFTQWNPDLIYFNNNEVKPTVNYYIQQLFGQNSGNSYINSTVQLSDEREIVGKRIGVSIVHDSKTNDYIVKLVNMLPVEAAVRVNLSGMGNFNPQATQIVLTGKPGDKKSLPVTNNISVNENFTSHLPAYSFTLIRIKSGDIR